MLQEEQSIELMDKFKELKEIAEKTKSPKDIRKFKEHKALCYKKFLYIIKSKTNKYKKFNNYEDLNQEGSEALLKAMDTFDKQKSPSFFFWAHRYIDTKISRKANQHSAVKYPLKVAKENMPHKENTMPILISLNRPDREYEMAEVEQLISFGMEKLNSTQKKILELMFGFYEPKKTVKEICETMNITRNECTKIIRNSFKILRTNIKV